VEHMHRNCVVTQAKNKISDLGFINGIKTTKKFDFMQISITIFQRKKPKHRTIGTYYFFEPRSSEGEGFPGALF